jgi:hypothetical protein
MVQVRGQYPKGSDVKSMDGTREPALQQSRSTGNLKSHCAASPELLSSHLVRRESLVEVKQLLREVNNPELSQRLNSLINEIYMDAEYRERTNAQLKEMVVGYENQIQNWERNGSYYRQDDAASTHLHPNSLKHSLRRYEKLLGEADTERVSLLNEVTILSKENYQLRV